MPLYYSVKPYIVLETRGKNKKTAVKSITPANK